MSIVYIVNYFIHSSQFKLILIANNRAQNKSKVSLHAVKLKCLKLKIKVFKAT